MCDHKSHQDISQLLEQNRLWADQMVESDPDFFKRLSDQQNPDFLWIGCSDSRVPANQIINLPPGEVFVHRNVANVLHHNDMNALSVIQFAVDVLKIKHIMIVGHYGCGGIRAAVTGGDNGIVDYWLNTVRNLYHQHQESLSDLSLDEQINRMCEINVKAQVSNLCQTKILQRAWEREQEVTVHGWCYSLENGLVKDLDSTVRNFDEAEAFRLAR